MIYRSKGKTEIEILYLSHPIPMDLFLKRFPRISRFPRFICFSRVTHTPIERFVPEVNHVEEILDDSCVTYTPDERFVPEEENIDRSISLSDIQPILTANCQLPIRSIPMSICPFNGQSIVTTIKDIPNPIIKIILNTYLPEFGMSLAEKIIGDAVLHGCVDVFEYINSVIGFDFSNSRDYYLDAVRSNNVGMVKYLYSNGFPIEKGVFEEYNLVSYGYYMAAFKFRNKRMIEYLYSMGFPLKASFFSDVAEENDIEIVSWLISKKCPFWGFECEQACISGQVDMYNLLFRNEYYKLDYKIFQGVIHQGDLDALKILYSKHCPFDRVKCSIIAAKKKYYHIMDFMISKNIFVLSNDYKECYMARIHKKVLDWLESEHKYIFRPKFNCYDDD